MFTLNQQINSSLHHLPHPQYRIQYHIMDPLPFKPTRHDVYDFISPTAGTKNAAVGKAVLVTGAGSGIGEVRTHFPNGLISSTSSLTLTERLTCFSIPPSILPVQERLPSSSPAEMPRPLRSPKSASRPNPPNVTCSASQPTSPSPKPSQTSSKRPAKSTSSSITLDPREPSAHWRRPTFRNGGWLLYDVPSIFDFGNQIASRLISYRTSTSEARTWLLASS